MKLPSLPHSKLHLTRPQYHSLEKLVDDGKDMMHLATRTLVGRAASPDSGSASSTCKPGNNAAICAKPADSSDTQTLPIVLGAVIPISIALIVFFFLHRRLRRKQRVEDANDPHKSLDFGVDMAPSKGRNKGNIPEMTITDMGGDPMRPGRRPRGLSLDMDMSSPYLLPGGLQGSRESIHSMSRSLHDEHDPYRPVTMMRTSTDSSRPRPSDNGSVYSASTMQSANEKANLLANAQRMSRSEPKRVDSMSPHTSKSSDDLPMRPMHSNNRSLPASRKSSLGSPDQPLPNITEMPPPRKQSMPKSLPQPPRVPEPVQKAPPPRSSSASRPPRKSSASAGAASRHNSMGRQSSNYGDAPRNAPPVPTVNEPRDSDYGIDPNMISIGRYSIDTPNPSQQFPVQTQEAPPMGLRPLPTDLPEDNPEMRANRIRSFYKEYFDESRPNPAYGQYEEDYDASYMMDGAIYDPETGGFITAGKKPFAEPVGRRAMTPPPRGAPRRQGPHRRQYSTQSAGRPGQLRGRQPGPPPPMPTKRAPPPKPLLGLPTPHKLKDYDSVINSPLDFAPPASFREFQKGSRPSSPSSAGESFPYSPTVKAFTPLATAYDELSVMPSPHHLRRSGTFTALDFAPPSRLGAYNDNGGNSDAGSIRSARSGISARQMDAVRAGAYRVSRIPKEMVTTREDLASQLRPRMDMSTPA